MKKLLVLLILSLVLVGCAKSEDQLKEEGWVLNPAENGYVFQSELPAPVDTTKKYVPAQGEAEKDCAAGVYSASCSSIGVENLEQYLNRDDVLYIDVRDFKDYTMKHFRNFEVIPYFAYIFNAEAHTDLTKVQLYGGSIAEPVAVYEESDAILEALFPKDKTIFIMCQSGGRVAQLMKILEVKGYDMSKIYNVGGVGQYTDAKFSPYITNTGEFTVEATYVLTELTRK
jgi:rhodanese-related sulfurtransferase